MELTKSEQREIGTSISTRPERSIEVPVNLSRQKAIQYINTHSEARGGEIQGIPEKESSNLIYRLYMKIGATSELPEDNNLARAYLNDFWIDMYLKNNLVPGDIPFPIIIREFTTAMVQGRVERKGNNQAAICQAFNHWVSQGEVRSRLYQLRDEGYPDKKPKQVTDGGKEISEYSDKELSEELDKTNKLMESGPFEGSKFLKEWKTKIEAEIGRRKEMKSPIPKNEKGNYSPF